MRISGWMEAWKQRAKQVSRETYALWLAYRDPRVPWYARVFAGCVVAYALSPVDLIPDFIPVLGALDDLVLIPLGLTLALRMIPAEVMAESRVKAQAALGQTRRSRVVGALVIAIWLVLLGTVAWLAWRTLGR